MRIGVNGFEAVVPRFGYDSNGLPNRVGSSQVCFQWLTELEKIDKNNEYTIFLPCEPTSDLPSEREGWRYRIVPNKFLWTIFALSPAVRHENFDVFFSPSHYGILSNCPQVVSILDLSYKYFPDLFKTKDLFQLKFWGGYSVRNASRVITISNSAKNDIIKEFKVAPGKVAVAYLGAKQVLSSKDKELSMEELSKKFNVKKPYVLFVGTLQPRKNIVRLIEAFSKLNRSSSPLSLIIVGRRGWKFEEILSAPKKYGVEDRVRFLENVTDKDLPAFYKNAESFVLPSLYEGFGLPILEAFEYGCPVLTSNVSSLPEAGGDAAIYFDPENALDIKDKIEKVLSDEKLRDDMIKKGHEQIKKFSWEKSAKQVLAVLEEVGKA